MAGRKQKDLQEEKAKKKKAALRVSCDSLSTGRSSDGGNNGGITQKWQEAEFCQLASSSRVL